MTFPASVICQLCPGSGRVVIFDIDPISAELVDTGNFVTGSADGDMIEILCLVLERRQVQQSRIDWLLENDRTAGSKNTN